MSRPTVERGETGVAFGWNEVSGAVGDAATVLPVVTAVAVLTELSLTVMLVWFGVFQVVWGLYYGAPVSVEPMKALAALVIAGALSTGELAVAGLLLAGSLLVIGTTGTLATVERYVGPSVVRGVQLGVALVLLETGVGLSLGGPWLAALAVALATLTALTGHGTLSAFVVFLGGAVVAVLQGGLPAPALPGVDALFVLPAVDLTAGAVEASLAQAGMTIGNAALATSLLLGDYFDRDIPPDRLSASMGAMNAVAVPFGAFPMCHGSGGVAGKFAFGARTAGANVVLGVGYVLVALLAVGLVATFPTAVLGVVLAVVALQLAHTAIAETGDYLLVGVVAVVGLVLNLGIAFALGIVLYHARSLLR
jgi:hypothetical protein